MMDFVVNVPFITILLSLMSGPISMLVKEKGSKIINLCMMSVVWLLTAWVFVYTLQTSEIYVYRMGHFPAPWGNEIRFGVLETLLALFFTTVMILCVLGGMKERNREVESSKQNLYSIMVNLTLTSLLALIYTNDLFTAYVFVEINTIAACALIMITQSGRTLVASVKYLIMNLLASSTLLLGICFLYTLTGQLLMSNIQQSIQTIVSSGMYHIPLMVGIGLISVGLAMKSALFPFHTWLPDAYGYSTVSSAAILSSLVSKGYIFLLIKIYYRVIGIGVIRDSHIANALFILGICGMIFGSINAIRESDMMRMIAYSSVAQIGYIYMGIGLGTKLGFVAAIFQIFSHAITKAMMFIAARGLIESSGGSRNFHGLKGAGYRNVLCGIGFTIDCASMVGIPLFSGFMAKVLFAQAGMGSPHKMWFVLIALAISAILNTMYFMKTVITIYTPVSKDSDAKDSMLVTMRMQPMKSVVLLVFIAFNIYLGLFSSGIVETIRTGLSLFS